MSVFLSLLGGLLYLQVFEGKVKYFSIEFQIISNSYGYLWLKLSRVRVYFLFCLVESLVLAPRVTLWLNLRSLYSGF